MSIRDTLRTAATASAVALLLITAGDVRAVSNVAFKFVKPITLRPGGVKGEQGKNWTALPYINSYGTAQDLCDKTALIDSGSFAASIGVRDPSTGSLARVVCGTPEAAALTLVPGSGVEIIQPSTTGAPTSIVLVGAHNPALAITIPDSGIDNSIVFLLALPYNTTVLYARDLCTQANLSTAATVTRLNASTGDRLTAACGSPDADTMFLPVGWAIEILEPLGPRTFVPATH